MYSKGDLNRRIKNDTGRKSSKKSQNGFNKTPGLKNTINYNARRISNQSKRSTNSNNNTLSEISYNAQRVSNQSKKPTNLNNNRVLNEISYNARRVSNQSVKPTNLNNNRALNEINYNAQRAAAQLGRRAINFKDKNALNKELQYKELQEKLTNRRFGVIGSSIVSEPPAEPPVITGDFLVRENNFFIATENDKLIELDFS